VQNPVAEKKITQKTHAHPREKKGWKATTTPKPNPLVFPFPSHPRAAAAKAQAQELATEVRRTRLSLLERRAPISHLDSRISGFVDKFFFSEFLSQISLFLNEV